MDKINSVIMTVLSKATSNFNAIPITVAFFRDIGKAVLTGIGNHRRPKTAKAAPAWEMVEAAQSLTAGP